MGKMYKNRTPKEMMESVRKTPGSSILKKKPTKPKKKKESFTDKFDKYR